MANIAKIFMNGNSQAVRLPQEYRFDSTEVFIRRDPLTGDVILSKRPGTWSDFFAVVASGDVPQDFMADRDDRPPQERTLFDEEDAK